MRAWEGLDNFRGDCTFATWLHRVAVNVMLQSDRSRRRRSLRVAIESDLAAPDDTSDARYDAPSRGPDIALALDLEQAIARLPAGARAVFVLHDVEGFTHEEISEQLGVAVGTSKSQLSRAREKLRVALAPFARRELA